MTPRRLGFLSVWLGLTMCWLMPQPTAAAVAEPKRTEQQWIVQSILEDLARMTFFAAHEPIPAETAPIVRVQEKPADARGAHFSATVQWPGEAAEEQPVDLPVHIWNADGYAKVAAGFLEKRKLASEAGAAAPKGSALKTLTAFDTATVEKENQRLSKWVTEHPLDVEAHSQAALLLAVFACRETSGAFYDTRWALNRGAAHLALAQALRKEAAPSDSAAVAALLFTLHTGRGLDTEEALKALEPRAAQQPELRPWLMAARVRERGNWRLVKDPSKVTPLERVEYYRAYEAAVGSEAVAEDLNRRRVKVTADWPRIVLTRSFSVRDGFKYVPISLGLELKEVAQIYPQAIGKEGELPTAAALEAALNQAPQGAVASRSGNKTAVEIIDPGAWALYFQRHLCQAIHQTHVLLEEMSGGPAKAAPMRQFSDQVYHGLWLYPLTTLNTRPDWLAANVPGLRSLIGQHPEWVEPHFWQTARRSLKDLAPLESFCSPPLPVGTLYGYFTAGRESGRRSAFEKLPTTDPAELERLVALAPWNFEVANLAIDSGKVPPPQIVETLERFLDYDLRAIRVSARAAYDQPELWLRIMRNGAAFYPEYLIDIVNYLRDHQRLAEAVEAFQKARSVGDISIDLANNSDWVVNHYFDQGDMAKAEETAKFAADVASSAGLGTMARFRERQGQLEEAEKFFSEIADRYNDPGPLFGLYWRHGGKRGSPYAKRLQELTNVIFPEGRKKVRLADFRDAPQRGLLVSEENPAVLRAGLKIGDIIVALNGERIESSEQYYAVRSLDNLPDMRIILYREGAGYLELACRQDQRRFGAKWPTYDVERTRGNAR